MILSPGILGLLVVSAMVSLAVSIASLFAVGLAAGWNDRDLSESQLRRERRFWLVELIMLVCLPICTLTLLLFVVTIERIHPLFIGAMCAMGTLNAGNFGSATLGVKVIAALLCCLWMVLHRATSRAVPCRSVLRVRVGLLVVIAGTLVLDTVLQVGFFRSLRPDVLTSCCAISFDEAGTGLGARISAASIVPARLSFLAMLGMTAGTGWSFLRNHRSPLPFVIATVVLSLISAAAVLIWIAPGFYELPTHHCPFCLLSPDLAVTGYLLYGSLVAGAVFGVGSGAVRLLRRLDDGSCVVDGEENRLCRWSLTAFSIFAAVAVWPLLTSDFRLVGY